METGKLWDLHDDFYTPGVCLGIPTIQYPILDNLEPDACRVFRLNGKIVTKAVVSRTLLKERLYGDFTFIRQAQVGKIVQTSGNSKALASIISGTHHSAAQTLPLTFKRYVAGLATRKSSWMQCSSCEWGVCTQRYQGGQLKDRRHNRLRLASPHFRHISAMYVRASPRCSQAFRVPTRLSQLRSCLLYTSPSPRDRQKSRMPSSA